MAKFRWHRGGLAESMATMIEGTPAELCAVITAEHPQAIIESSHCGFDERIGWDTYMVTADGKPVGFSDVRLGPKPKTRSMMP